jgi:uncharacterized protein (TIGR02246 family)
MKLFLLSFCAAGLLAQSPETAIRALLDKQVADWNRGDIPAFMEGYEKSDKLLFVGKSVTRGHAATLANYLKRYPDRAHMGTLRFEILEVDLLGEGHALVLGRFHLTRTGEGGGNADGVFTLVFRKSAGQWRIIADHTS